MYYIYKITHRENGQFYIGYTNNPKRRWREHKQAARAGESSRLYNTMRKYGLDAFDFIVLEEMDCSVQQAKDREVEVIAELRPQYNCTKGGDGHEPDEETRAKMSESQRNSPACADKATRAWKTRRERYTPEEITQQIIQSNASLTPDQYAAKVEKCRDANINRNPEAEAARQRKRAETIANWTPEQREAYSANLSTDIKARELSEEQQAKISEGQRKGGLIQGPKIKAMIDALSPDEQKARMDNIIAGIKLAATNRTQEQKDEITRKRLESRERNKTAREQSLLNSLFADC